MTLPELFSNPPTPGGSAPWVMTTLAASVPTNPAAGTQEGWVFAASPPAALAKAGQFRFIVDSEVLLDVTGGTGTARQVLRGQDGSTTAPHSSGANVYHALTQGALGLLTPYPVLSARQILEVGVANQIKAGRVLTVADFTTLMGLSQPLGLWNLNVDIGNLGSGGGPLVNKNSTVLSGKGITGTASEAVVFTGGSSSSALYGDSGGTAFAIRTGSMGCWMRTAKSGVYQTLMAKRASGDGSGTHGFIFRVEAGTNALQFWGDPNNTVWTTAVVGATVVTDDRWHFVVVTYDGSIARIYVDGTLDAAGTGISGPLYPSTGPFNLGNFGADAGTLGSTTESHYGRIDEAFLTSDVLNGDQVRMLYAAKAAHGVSFTPSRVQTNVRRLRRGGSFATSDFTNTSHLRVYNLANLNDSGPDALGLSNPATAPQVAGPDGEAASAYHFDGSTQYLTAVVTNLPVGTAALAMGGWFKSNGPVAAGGTRIINYGTSGSAGAFLMLNVSTGSWQFSDYSDAISAVYGLDGNWHFVVAVADPSPGDGLKKKLYVDGRLVAGGTVWNGVGATPAGSLTIARSFEGSAAYYTGDASRLFIAPYVMAQDEISSLYAKGAVALGASPINPGDIVEQVDATNVYMVNDILPSQHQLDLIVGA